MAEATVAKFATVQKEGNRIVERQIDFYNLDVIISVGYRVKSLRGTQFRIWATNILKEYMKKGFALDDDRLKNLGGGNYFEELLSRIRDIRSSEKVFWRKVLEMAITLSGAMGQEESRNLSENIQWGIKRKFEEGLFSSYKHFMGKGYKTVTGKKLWSANVIQQMLKNARVIINITSTKLATMRL